MLKGLALRRRGLDLPPPMVVANSWFSDSKLLRHVSRKHQSILMVEEKASYVFMLPDSRRVKGSAFLEPRAWPTMMYPRA
jgi:hypothetical protein